MWLAVAVSMAGALVTMSGVLAVQRWESWALGTVLSYPLVDWLEPEVLGWLLSLSAGALLYVGASQLLPQISGERGRFVLLALLGGRSRSRDHTLAGG